MHPSPYVWKGIVLAAALIFAGGAWAERWKSHRDRLGKKLRIYTVVQAFSTLQPDEVWRTRVTFDAEEKSGDYVITVRLLGRHAGKLANPEDPSAAADPRTVAVALHRPRDKLDNTAHGDVLLYAPEGRRGIPIRIELRSAGEPRLLAACPVKLTVARPVQ